jgi:hypothetical protein
MWYSRVQEGADTAASLYEGSAIPRAARMWLLCGTAAADCAAAVMGQMAAKFELQAIATPAPASGHFRAGSIHTGRHTLPTGLQLLTTVSQETFGLGSSPSRCAAES